ncbi:MAG TPA: endo-1,4-beta-xylanase [Fimbriimonadaceae bacterium]|nr:endo-1,4-beta-xylanase [Fimbriimonadaceae bacterium]
MITTLLLMAITLREAGAKAHLDIGTAVDPSYFAEPPYRDILASEFSVIEPENGMKFDPVHPEPGRYDFAIGDAIVKFAQEHRLKVRGHTLVWHNQLPKWVTGGNYSPEQMSAVLHNHIKNVVGHYKGQVYAWDVVNEAFNDDGTMRPSPWYDKPGIGDAGQGTKYIEQALRWTHEADPKAKLFYNDYSAEEMNKKSDAILAMAKDFKARGVPLDGIGFQCHAAPWYLTPKWLASFEANLKRFAAAGLEVQITELDCALTDDKPEALSAEAYIYRQIAAIARRQPKCTLLQIWGFTDKHSWISQRPGSGWALPWDADYNKKPAYDGIIDGLVWR